MQYFNAYAFYDHKGRRLSVFCRFLDYSTAEIFTLTCSFSDQFSRKFAREQYQKHLDDLPLESKPTIVNVTIKPEQREIQCLMEYCKDNFYYIVEVPCMTSEEYLIPVKEYYPLIY